MGIAVEKTAEADAYGLRIVSSVRCWTVKPQARNSTPVVLSAEGAVDGMAVTCGGDGNGFTKQVVVRCGTCRAKRNTTPPALLVLALATEYKVIDGKRVWGRARWTAREVVRRSPRRKAADVRRDIDNGDEVGLITEEAVSYADAEQRFGQAFVHALLLDELPPQVQRSYQVLAEPRAAFSSTNIPSSPTERFVVTCRRCNSRHQVTIRSLGKRAESVRWTRGSWSWGDPPSLRYPSFEI